MAIVKEKKIVKDKVMVLKDGQIEVLENVTVKENGKEIAQGSLHGHVICPGDSLENEVDWVRELAKKIHTEKVVQDYKTIIERE